MINRDDGEINLLKFYDISSIRPTSLDQLNIKGIDDENIENLSVDQQFDVLNQLLKGHKNNGKQDGKFNENDVEDPLRGNGTNVIRELIDRQVVSSKNDSSINQYLISSREFDSAKFLTTIHKDTPMETLSGYLKYLESSIQQQKAELQYVIDNNYLKFIDVKDSIDEILTNFKAQKTKVQQEMEKIRIFNPSRLKDYNKDSKSLVSGLEDSIKNLTMATSILLRPIIDNEAKETKISNIIEFIKDHKEFFNLPSILMKAVSNKHHEEIIEALGNYSRQKKLLLDQQDFKLKQVNSKDKSKFQKVIVDQQRVNTLVNKVFQQVDNIVEDYKVSIYNELLTFDYDLGKGKRQNNTRFLSIVDKIDQLNTTSGAPNVSPINTFLKTQLTNANDDLFYQLNKFEDKFVLMQAKISNYIEPLHHRTNGSFVKYIKVNFWNVEGEFQSTTSRPSLEDLEVTIMEMFNSIENLDLSLINETWLLFLNFITYLEDVYLRNINKFIENYNYYIHHNNIDVNGQIRKLFFDTMIQISDKLYKIFNNQDKITNQLESSPNHYSNILPNHCNSLSAVYYLTRINSRLNNVLANFGKNITFIGNTGKTTETNKLIKNLRNISTLINQKILESTCSVWVNDCSQMFDLEAWEIDIIPFNKTDEDATNTKLVSIIDFYMIYMLKQIESLVCSHVHDDHANIVLKYPNKKMLVSIEIQFMRCLSILIESIMKKYNLEQQHLTEANFKILTINNIDNIARKVFPNLLENYDKKFDKDLSNQRLKLFTDIDKVSLTILDDILSKEKLILDDILSGFFNKVSRVNGEIKIDNFIYEALIHFVKLVYNLKPITHKEFFIKIINELQDFFLKNFLDYFRKLNNSIPNFNIILIHLKLDVNFFIEVFEKSQVLKLNDYTFNIAEILLNSIKQLESDTINDKEFDSILLQALADSENQFDCLGR